MRLAALAVALVAATAHAQPVGWGQYQGDAAHTGYVPQAVDPALIRPAWAVTAAALGGGYARPTVVTDETGVYLTTVAGSAGNGYVTNRVHRLSAATGAVSWTYTRQSYLFSASSPSVSGGRVYVQFAGSTASPTVPGPDDQQPRMVGLAAATGTPLFATAYQAQSGYNT